MTSTSTRTTARQSNSQQHPWHRVRVRFGEEEFEDAVRGADRAEAIGAAVANWYLDTPSRPANEITYLGLDNGHGEPESSLPNGAVTVTARRGSAPAPDNSDQLTIRTNEALPRVEFTSAPAGACAGG